MILHTVTKNTHKNTLFPEDKKWLKMKYTKDTKLIVNSVNKVLPVFPLSIHIFLFFHSHPVILLSTS